MALSKVADAATPFCHHNAESQFYGFFKTKEGQTQRYTYIVLQTIQMNLTLLCVLPK